MKADHSSLRNKLRALTGSKKSRRKSIGSISSGSSRSPRTSGNDRLSTSLIAIKSESSSGSSQDGVSLSGSSFGSSHFEIPASRIKNFEFFECSGSEALVDSKSSEELMESSAEPIANSTPEGQNSTIHEDFGGLLNQTGRSVHSSIGDVQDFDKSGDDKELDHNKESANDEVDLEVEATESEEATTIASSRQTVVEAIRRRPFTRSKGTVDEDPDHVPEAAVPVKKTRPSTSRRSQGSNGKPHELFKCIICKKGARQRKQLKRHMASHLSQVCKEMQDVSGGALVYKCGICQRIFKTRGALASHLQIHVKSST